MLENLAARYSVAEGTNMFDITVEGTNLFDITVTWERKDVRYYVSLIFGDL